MKSVLISIKPKWCALIANGEKTIEVRKNRPKIETPFKCYIYCTKGDNLWIGNIALRMITDTVACVSNKKDLECVYLGTGKVIGEFVCDSILPMSIEFSEPSKVIAMEVPYMGLTDKEVVNYLGNGKTGYGWHISNLVIYDKPKELREFLKPCTDPFRYCEACTHGHVILPPDVETYEDYLAGCFYETICSNRVTRPPQSWRYVDIGELKRK